MLQEHSLASPLHHVIQLEVLFGDEWRLRGRLLQGFDLLKRFGRKCDRGANRVANPINIVIPSFAVPHANEPSKSRRDVYVEGVVLGHDLVVVGHSREDI